MRPQYIGIDTTGMRLNRRRAIYVTMAELYIWAWNKNQTTQEGEPYHDCLDRWNNVMGRILALFDGTETITLPDGTTATAPKILPSKDEVDYDAITEYYLYDNNTRFANWPLFPLAQMYTDNNDYEWYTVFSRTMNRAERYAYTQAPGIFRQYKGLLLEYNPESDHWTKSKKIVGNAPYATLGPTGTDQMDPQVSSWSAGNTGHTEYISTNTISNSNPVRTKNETTTFDNTSLRNLDQSTQTGETSTTNSLVNTAGFEKYEEEGNKGAIPIQDLINKELELSRAYDDIYKNFMKGLDNEILLSYWRGA